MVLVRRIAHAGFETPDPERLVGYYTDVIGLSVVGRDKDATYLASLQDHAVVIRRGSSPRCVRLAFQIAPDGDLAEFEKGIKSHNIKTARKTDPEPGIPEIVTFEDPKGTTLEVFRERELPKAPAHRVTAAAPTARPTSTVWPPIMTPSAVASPVPAAQHQTCG